jgi:hypothetical protein
MKPDLPDHEFERRLRDVLHSRQLSIDPAADAIEKIHAGAHRRQVRHRVATSGLAAMAVIAVAVTGIVLRPANHTTTVAGSAKTPDATARPASSGPAAPSPSLLFGGANKLASPLATSAASAPVPVTTTAATIPAGGAPPAGFVPMSVTATTASGSTFWVLGHAPCSAGTCTALAKTTNGGKTFTEVGAPPVTLVPDDPGNDDVFGSSTISDVRFVDANDGWAYGGALWQTNDGGQSWTRVDGVEGSVEQLTVASGHVWAIVNLGTGPTYALYTATYPNGRWSQVKGAGSFGPGEPALAVHDTTVVVVGESAGSPRYVRSTDAATFTPVSATCGPPSPPSLSATSGAQWLLCGAVSTLTGGILVSTDSGASWHIVATGTFGSDAAVGAIDAKSAIVGTAGKLERVGSDGSTTAVSMPSSGSPTWSFIGFTNTSDGFAIPILNNTRQLWRTTDGGAHWSVVKF